MSDYFGIGIESIKNGSNIGTLWRSAFIYGASFIFTINHRYHKQGSDTTKTWHSIPLFHYDTIDDLIIPYGCKLIGIEIINGCKKLSTYKHPKRCIYLLGPEDGSLSKSAISKCDDIVQIDGGDICLNVSTAGSIVMWHRKISKEMK